MTRRDDHLIRVARDGQPKANTGPTQALSTKHLSPSQVAATRRAAGLPSRPTLRTGARPRRARSSNGGALFLAFAVVAVIAMAAVASRWQGSDTATAPAPIEEPAAPLATWVPPTATVPPPVATLFPTQDIPCGKDFIVVGDTHCPPQPLGIEPEYEYQPSP